MIEQNIDFKAAFENFRTLRKIEKNKFYSKDTKVKSFKAFQFYVEAKNYPKITPLYRGNKLVNASQVTKSNVENL